MSENNVASKNMQVSSPVSIRYQVSLLSSTEHLIGVTMDISLQSNALGNKERITVSLPTWIPGSYMVRDFARNLHVLEVAKINEKALNASSTTLIDIQQIDKQTWALINNSEDSITSLSLHYQIYAYDLSVRSAFINHEYAFFNGTSVFLSVEGMLDAEHQVIVDEPSFSDNLFGDECKIVTAMTKSTAPHSYSCNDYYELIEHPFLIGNVNSYSFELKGCLFHLVFTGQDKLDLMRIASDLSPIIEHHLHLFGDIPCKEYWFMTLVCEGGFGGLEHIASTVLQYSRYELPFINDPGQKDKVSDGYQRFLSLCSHEFFHTWHVKQIKPEVMHKPDLSQEVYTPQLWIYEGFTSLYDDLSLARAGVISPNAYVQVLNEVFTRLLKNTGRHKQSVSSSSFEAWSKFYKQDAGSVNHIVSYYNKGTVVALCLDIMIRQKSNNMYSLDDIMRLLWEHHGKTHIGTPDDIIHTLCKDHLNIDISTFLHMATRTTMDLPFGSLLQSIGLEMQLRASQGMTDKGDFKELLYNYDVGATLTFNKHGNVSCITVNAVHQGRAASQAGLMLNDAIIAVNHQQCDEARFMRILHQQEEGDNITLHVLRDARLIELTMPVVKAQHDTCYISISDESRFYAWLGK